MANVIDMAHSLGFYVHLKRTQGSTKQNFLDAGDYHDFLHDVEGSAQTNAAIAGFSNEHPLVPLSEITLTQVQYGDVLEQMFDGDIQYMALSIPLGVPPPPVIQHPSYFAQYLQALGGDSRTENDVSSIVARIEKLLSEREVNEQRVNGLVVGRVQSGKTRNYIGLMLKAIDQGWNVVIVLTSNNTALADQTERRIVKELTRSHVYPGIKLDFRNGIAVQPQALLTPNCQNFYWGVAMKEVHNLNNVIAWLQESPGIVETMRVLIIDDEADNATPDSNVGKNGLYSAGEADDIIACVRDEDDDGNSDYTSLADWLDSVPDIIEEIAAAIEADPNHDPAPALVQTLQSLKTLLSSSGSDTKKRQELLGNDQFLDLLNLQPHLTQEGQWIDVPSSINAYFNPPGGSPRNSFRKSSVFVRLLKSFFEIANTRSAINRRICEIIDCKPGSNDYSYKFAKCAYVGYTATPYACILNEGPDQTPIYADFIMSLTMSPHYFGLDKIFGRNLKSEDPNMHVVDAIEDTDKRFVLNPIQGVKDQEKHPAAVLNVTAPDQYLCYTCQNPNYSGSWDSLKRAVAWAFCTAGARKWYRDTKYVPWLMGNPNLDQDDKDRLLKELDYRWTTMMVNISQKQDSHERIRSVLSGYLASIFATPDAIENYVAQCQATWSGVAQNFTKADFDALFVTGADAVDPHWNAQDYPTWAEIEPCIRYFIQGWNGHRVHTIVINSETPANRDKQDYYNQVGNHADTLQGDNLWFVIGGNTISRGLTLVGLTVSYFDRVRKTVAVDTLTQMGRWFGYRDHYELLPRIWMRSDTLMEYKRTAIVEQRMHESIRDNFDAEYAPTDPAHYQQIYSWGRKLSGRARAMSAVSKNPGTNASTDDIFVAADKIEAIYNRALQFIGTLGAQAVRPAPIFRLYNQYPLWTAVDKGSVKSYLTDILPHYPERSQQVLRGIIHEIDNAESQNPDDDKWDVVIGEPDNHRGLAYPIGIGHDVFSGQPQTAHVYDGIARYTSLRSYLAFYAMIPTDVLNQTDAEFVEENIDRIVGVIERSVAAHNGQLPQTYATALAHYPAATLKQRVLDLVNDVLHHPNKEIPTSIRECLTSGFRNRSLGDYFEAVHANADHRRPVLQLYLVTPPPGAEHTAAPMISHAMYWPNHLPDEFHAVVAGAAVADEHVTINPRKIWNKTAEVLLAANFPMALTNGLSAAVKAGLPDYPEEAIANCIAHNDGYAPYRKYPGKTGVFYHETWANDPVAKLHDFMVAHVADILVDHQEHLRTDLINQVKAETPKLNGLFNFASGNELAAAFSPERLAAHGIVKTCGHPVKYQIP